MACRETGTVTTTNPAALHTEPITPATIAAYGRYLLDLAEATPDHLLTTIDIALPNLDLRVFMPEGQLADAVRTACIQPRLRFPGSARMIKITVLHPGVGGAPDPLEWGKERYTAHEISNLLSQAGLQGSLFHDLRFWQFYDLAAGRGVQLMAGAEMFPPWEPGAPLRAFLHWEYAAQGRRMTHAGSLGRDGRGVLLAGAGGAGKSGTVLAGLLGGLSSVGDDYVLVDLLDGRPSAFPIFTTLKQDDRGVRRLELDRRLGPRSLNWQDKIQFRTSDIEADISLDGLSIGAILLPRIGAEATVFTVASRAEAMLALAPSAVYQMPGERESGFRFFSRLVSMLPAYRLDLGPDPEEIAGALSSFINGLPS